MSRGAEKRRQRKRFAAAYTADSVTLHLLSRDQAPQRVSTAFDGYVLVFRGRSLLGIGSVKFASRIRLTLRGRTGIAGTKSVPIELTARAYGIARRSRNIRSMASPTSTAMGTKS